MACCFVIQQMNVKAWIVSMLAQTEKENIHQDYMAYIKIFTEL